MMGLSSIFRLARDFQTERGTRNAYEQRAPFQCRGGVHDLYGKG